MTAVADEGVASDIPAVAHIVRLPVIGEIPATGRSAHGELAGGAIGQFVHVVVNNLRFISSHGITGRSRSRIIDTVADEDVQQFRGSDAIEDRLAGLFGPL